MWLGTVEGEVIVLDAITKHTQLRRQLVVPHQPITSIDHLLTNRWVGYHIVCENIHEHTHYFF